MTLTDILHTFDDDKEIVKVGEKYVEKDTEASLKGILQRERLKLSRASSPPRRGVSFAPHAITYPFCRRAKIGQLAGFLDLYYDRTSPKEATGFDLGKYLHDMVQTYFWDIGLLKGTYECLKCDKNYHEIVAPEVCPSGKVTHKRKHLRYREVTASNDEYSLYGRSDGILTIEDGRLLEIKSLAAKPFSGSSDRAFYFEDLVEKGPREMHITQLMFYMFMMEIHKGYLLYISKNTGQMRTFNITYDHSLIEPYLNEIKYLKEQSALLKAGEKISLPACCDSDKCSCHLIISPMPVS